MSAVTVKLRSGLIFSQQAGSEGATFVVKDPVRERFFRFREIEGFILQLLDGRTVLEEVLRRVQERFQASLSEQMLHQFIQRLDALGLLEKEPAEGHSCQGRRGRVGGDLFYLRFKAFDPDRLFDRLIAKVRFFFTGEFVLISAALILLASAVTACNWPQVGRDIQGLFRFQSALFVWGIVILVSTAHEFAHGLACKSFGGKVHELGCMLIYFQPAFYCNVSDAWLFPEKSKRLWVSFAGAYFEIFLWALATLIWRLTEPSSWLNYVALVVMATSGIKTFFNLNPLIKLDGYYLLSDYLEIPNLRSKALAYLGDRWRALWGSTVRRLGAVTRQERRIYRIYGLLAWAYTSWLLGWVGAKFGGYLIGRYHGWGFILFTLALGILFRHRLKRGWQACLSRCGWGGPKASSVKRAWRWVVGLTVAAVLVFGHMELRISGEFVVLPKHNADVRAEVEGIIEEFYVAEGAEVRAGDPMARLVNRDYAAELRGVTAAIAEQQAKLKLLKTGPRPEEIELAQTRLSKAQERLKYATLLLAMDRTLFEQQLLSKREYEQTEESVAVRQKESKEAQDQLELLLAGSRPEEIEALEAEIRRLEAQKRHLEEQLELLTVVSPIDGVITTHKLHEKIGQYVKKGDLVAEVHAMKTVTAEIAVSEKDIADVSVGKKVVLKARAYPQHSFRGTVTAIAPVVSKPDQGQSPRTVLVLTELRNSDLLLKPEMSGNAKIYCDKKPIFELVCRRLIRFLRVEFWSWW